MASSARLLSDRERLENLSKNAVNTVRAYTPAQLISEWESVFEECAVVREVG